LKDVKKPTQTTLINEKIRFPRVQLITSEGQNIGVVSREDMLRQAHESGLDAVVITEQGAEGVPVVKIMDYGKVQYTKKKNLNDAKKRQKVIRVKEIKMRPKIAEHDYQTKLHQGIEFVKEGMRLKITLEFKGREQATMQERGADFFEKINKTLEQEGLLGQIVQETDASMGKSWSRVYYLKK
jgi:translation initiation factor IF-3